MDDAATIIQQSKVCVFMKQGFGYTTATGIEFTPEQPFQMMDAVEAQLIMADNPERFRLAEKEEVLEFFSKDKNVGPKRLQMV